MKMTAKKSIQFLLALLVILSASELTFAGPPLICHPFEIGDAKSIPWEGKNWREVKRDYDLNRLVPDVMAILETDASILVRMETIRRAAVYSVWSQVDREVPIKVKDNKIAQALFDKIIARSKAAESRGFKTKADQLALFDAGYIVETFKYIYPMGIPNIATPYDGYNMVDNASHLMNKPGDVEFALAVILKNHKGQATIQDQHLKKAISTVAEGSLLAKNLINHFPERGTSLSQLRASVR